MHLRLGALQIRWETVELIIAIGGFIHRQSQDKISEKPKNRWQLHNAQFNYEWCSHKHFF